MNIQTLRYALTIAQTGSLNKAAKCLYISQSTLSRSLKELEEQIGISLFQRTNQGVKVTYAGQQFLDRTRRLLREIDQMESEYFHATQNDQYSLLIASQRCTTVVHAFTMFYERFCKGKELINLVIQEETGDKIMNMVCGGFFELGIFHYTSDQEQNLQMKCQEMNLELHLMERSPVCVQVRRDHPLAGKEHVTVEDLIPYPHIVYANEDLTGINSCSDITIYNPSVLKKRIVIQDRGALRQIISNTDGYYIGCEHSRFPFDDDLARCYIPLDGVGFTINTAWLSRRGHVLTQAENDFITVLEEVFEMEGDEGTL